MTRVVVISLVCLFVFTSLCLAKVRMVVSIPVIGPVPVTYFIAPAGAGGNDANNGLTSGAPWLTPNHALNCGDVILAAAGTYNEANFRPGQWGIVSCPTNDNVAWLKCSTFDTCKINITVAGHDAMTPTRSYWGVQGWEVTASTASTNQCFEFYPPDNTTTIHHDIFANNIANGCGDGAFTTGDVFGSTAPTAGVDYSAIIGNIAYNGAKDNTQCYSGIDIVAPFNSDTLPGTHFYIAGNFAWGNVDPNPCAGHAPTDGHGISIDTVNDVPAGNFLYSGQIFIDNNISVFNGASGIQVFDNTGGSPNAPIIIRHNTTYGNQTGAINANPCAEVNDNFSLSTQAISNLIQTSGATACAANVALYAIGTVGADSSVVMTPNFIFSAAGNNTNCSGGNCANNLTGTSPAFANPVVPPAPNCGAFASVPACMATLIANFTPANATAKTYGRQAPGAMAFDPLFPQWLCHVTNMPMGLITMGCPTPTPTPTPSPTPSPTPTPALGISYVDNSGSPACSDSNPGNSPSAPWCTVAKVAAIQSSLSAGNQVLFKCGDTWNEQLNISGVHGAVGNPVIFGHYGSNCVLPKQIETGSSSDYTPGNVVLPTFNGASTLPHAFFAIGTSVTYLTLDGFNIHDVTNTAIDFQTNGGMLGITIKNMLIHQSGAGACAGCGSPNDNGYNAQIGFQDFTQSQDGVQILNNTVWDTGGHNTIHVHFDTSPNVLVDHNLVGPGCIHNCIDTKGINGTVSNNITTCPTASARGAQCFSPGANAGYYTENPFVAAGTGGKWINNVAHDIPICFQLRGNDPNKVTPTLYNNTCFNAGTQGWDLSTTTSANVQKNIIGGSVGTGGIGTWDYNDVFGASGNPSGTHDININPTYVNTATFNFTPQNSTVCSAGAPDIVTTAPYIGGVPCAVPPPPTLVNPQIIQPGAVFGGHTISGNGTSDDTAAFKAADALGDLDIKAGIYSINGVAYASSINPPSGRNWLCENPIVSPAGPTAANATVVIKVPTAPSGDWNVIKNWSNGTLYGCEFQFWHYPAVTWTNPDGGSNESLIFNNTGNNALHVYANTFEGMPGFIGVITIITSFGTSIGPFDTNDDISYNSFKHCALRAVEPDYGKNIRITHNSILDCGLEPEIQDYRETGMTMLIDSNTLTFDTTFGGADNPFNIGWSAGDVCHTPGGGFPCTGTQSTDYSGNTASNNVCIGSGVNTWQIENFFNAQSPTTPAVYRNNILSGTCSIWDPPGNPNANSWGAGSNQ